MRFTSTNRQSAPVRLEDAINLCVAPDGGMFMPESLPRIPKALFNNIGEMSLPEIAFVVANSLLADDVPPEKLKAIVDDSFSFEAPLVQLDEHRYVLELFHGPTLTFKDFGARFMARLMSYLDSRRGGVKRNVLVATTGNTGAAAANGMLRLGGINVTVLYPKGRLTKAQTAQFTALGENIHPVEVAGTVEDCKRLVQEALADESLRDYHLTGANSINIARLLPQITFAMHAYSQLLALGESNADRATLAMPCGNCSNLVASLMARRMGLPTGPIIAATNANDQLRSLLAIGAPVGKPTPKATYARAIDMCVPSGWPRLASLFDGDPGKMSGEVICATPVSDDEIASTINDLRARFGYTIDPHGAVAYCAGAREGAPDAPMVAFATGHPAKQLDIMTRITGSAIELPVQLTRFMTVRRSSAIMAPTLPALKKHLQNLQ
ncbi:MAG: threonine synthase [Muribaculaceae bacterium]|nr:threonine synthase [Muribaculaceae bacterium]